MVSYCDVCSGITAWTSGSAEWNHPPGEICVCGGVNALIDDLHKIQQLTVSGEAVGPELGPEPTIDGLQDIISKISILANRGHILYMQRHP